MEKHTIETGFFEPVSPAEAFGGLSDEGVVAFALKTGFVVLAMKGFAGLCQNHQLSATKSTSPKLYISNW